MLRRLLVPGGILLAAVLLAAATALAGPAGEPATAASTVCASCHDQAKAFDTNPHAHAKGLAAEALCAACHGDGTAHAEAGGDKTKIVRPAGAAGEKVCLTCHDTQKTHASFRNGIHSKGEAVNCLSCHSIHAANPKGRNLLVKPQTALCATCHSDTVATFKAKPYAHRIGRGGMECSSCHEPHAVTGQKGLRFTRTEEQPCLSCHAEKRGPFVFEHPGGKAATCTSCHEPHGSNNPRRLVRANVYQLCLECHSPTNSATLGSQPPSFHNLLLPRYRNCTTCHTAIHGSNRSPQLLK